MANNKVRTLLESIPIPVSYILGIFLFLPLWIMVWPYTVYTVVKDKEMVKKFWMMN